ncbi:glycoside hydrolase family 3 C-terminal domain-containing protein [Paraflavisolibacter sp. H34]|uniref:beta-glucosidase n=1 Tax=Huijunlia imazamoxiresistens TaxID=3127457 RepID=UPI0030184B9E
MTLEEKATLVVGTGMRMEGKGPVVGDADGRVPGAAGNTMNSSRLGIPGTVLADGPAGVRIDPFRGKDSSRSYYATAWPVGMLLASSWDTSLVKRVGAAFGREIKEYGVDVILAPGMNIQRDPLNGRNFEYYSEDPLVSGLMAAAMVKGIQSNGVGTSIKHFAANNQETNRNNVNVIISERALREIYLKGFEIAVKQGQPWTVMSSYNKINGTYTSHSHDLLTKVLREEWRFQGYVMTDWFGGKDPIAQMKAGNDLIEPGNKRQSQQIVEAVKGGTLDSNVLDRNVERILGIIVKTPSFQKYAYSNSPDLKAHAALARNAAAESMVLLQNKGQVLPLGKGLKVALFGNASYDTYIGGTGSGDVYEAYSVSLANGLAKAGYKVLGELERSYTAHIKEDLAAHPRPKLALGAPRMTPELEPASGVIEQSAGEADVALFTIGRNAGEGGDRKVENNFDLSPAEQALLRQVAAAFHARGKKLVVVLNTGGVVETASWREAADAILLAWQPGQEGGNAVADVLSGRVNPSGKLATTFPLRYADAPSSKNFPGTPAEKPEEVRYEEGIYVGYRYHNSFGVKPAYPFGYGLSYTDFAYSQLQLSAPSFNGRITARVTITNTGKAAGREVIQLYLSAPAKILDKPSEELKGFAKTRLLQPGQSQTLFFELTAKDLASFHTDPSAWIAESGTYTVKIAASSQDIRLSRSFVLAKDTVVEKVNKALVPQVPLNELKPEKRPQ